MTTRHFNIVQKYKNIERELNVVHFVDYGNIKNLKFEKHFNFKYFGIFETFYPTDKIQVLHI